MYGPRTRTKQLALQSTLGFRKTTNYEFKNGK